MRIAFYANDPKWSQLSNGGGTRTILKSVEALKALGHDAYVVADEDRFTWFDHDRPWRDVKSGTDAVIAVHIHDVAHVMKLTDKVPFVGYWARPVETWSMPTHKAMSRLSKLVRSGGHIFCNSSWQVAHLGTIGIPATVQLAGMDDLWCGSLCKRKYIGFRAHRRSKDNGMDVIAHIAHRLGKGYRWACVGEPPDGFDFVEKIVPHADDHRMLRFYHSCRFFVGAPRFAGFFNPGAEAASCGCTTVIVDFPQGGWQDYRDAVWDAVDSEDAANKIRSGVTTLPVTPTAIIGTRLLQMNRFIQHIKEKME